MIRSRLLALLLLLPGICLLASCTEEDSDAVQGVIETPDATREMLGTEQVERAIQAYLAQNGRYPPSLDSLPSGSVPDLPEGRRYSYDPSTGEVEIVEAR